LDYGKFVAVMRKLALEAGDKIMEIYNSDDFDVKVKSTTARLPPPTRPPTRSSPPGLRAAFPDVMLVTEEQAASHAAKAETFLIVDPLDGTKEFIHRRGDFTVNIAYVEKGADARHRLCAQRKSACSTPLPTVRSVEEAGPFDKPMSPVKQRRSVCRTADNDALMVVASKSHRDQATDDYINKYAVADMKSAGSSLKFCLVATGEADLYPRVGRTMEWDTAAGHAVLLGAGGQVVRFDDHTPLAMARTGSPTRSSLPTRLRLS
jgi:3'(2'), 5'-bisphosphate nucleotidase